MKKILPALIIILLGCKSQETTTLGRIRQPRVLILAPNTEVKTTEGVYTSGPKPEIWHSAETVERLEKQLSQF